MTGETETKVESKQESYLGKPPGPYVPGTPWPYWKKMFNTFLAIRNITEDKTKKLVLISELGMAGNAALEGLLHNEDTDAKTFDDLMKILETHYTPKVLVIAERYKLLQLDQKEGQSLAEYYSELSLAARHCKFSEVRNVEDVMIRMAFVKGIRNKATRMKLLEKDEDGTSGALLTLAQAFEVAQAQSSSLTSTSKLTIGAVDRMNKPPHPPQRPQNGHAAPHNGMRGKSGYDKGKKPFGKQTQSHKSGQFQPKRTPCKHCGLINHRSENCFKNKGRHTHLMEVEDEEYDGSLGIFHVAINQSRIIPPVMLTVTTNSTPVKYELDTGASISIVDYPTWEQMGKPLLRKVGYSAQAYNDTKIAFEGTCRVELSLDGSRALLDLHVLDRKIRKLPLMGRDMIEALKMDMGPFYKGPPKVAELSRCESAETRLQLVLQENADLFRPELGKFTRRKAELKFKEDKPGTVFRRARPVPHALRPKVEAALENMVKQKVVTPIEHSEWASPLVIVPKPGGKLRICADFKQTLNPLLDINIYPLPKPEDLFQMLNGGEKYSKVDLKDAYLQMELSDEAKTYLVINTHRGLLRYERLPFGLASAPAIFQKSMEELLAGIEGVVIYLDDVTITAPNDKEHVERLAKVLSRFRTAGLRLRKDKCEFLKPEIEFLGHLVSKDGIKPNPDKVKAISEMPPPKDLKQIESFLGMIQYYAKFVPQLSALAAPLNHLRKNGVEFEWGQQQQKAFEALKNRLLQADRLTHYDPEIPVVLATDASDYGLGAVLYHRYQNGDEKAIAFASRSLTPAEKNYAQIEKEGLGIIFGVDKFNQYLYGRKFLLLTDHQPLVRIFGPKHEIPVVAQRRLTRWEIRLMEYSFEIEYRNTHEFGNADGLSRLPRMNQVPSSIRSEEERIVKTLNLEAVGSAAVPLEDWSRCSNQDPLLREIQRRLKLRESTCPNVREYLPFRHIWDQLSIVDGCVYWEHKLIVPKELQPKILGLLHENHFGVERMKSLARSKFWFPSMDKMIELTAKACETCAILGKKVPKIPLHSWEVAEKPWQRIHVDFAGPFHGFMWLLIVDAKTKWPEMIKMKSTTASATITKLRGVFAVHGIPEQIVSDNGPQLTSKELAAYCKEMGITHVFTPPYHPNSNGQAERYVQTLKNAIERCTYQQKGDLDTVVQRILFEYRTTPHPATGLSPAEALMGRNLRSKLDLVTPDPGATVIPKEKQEQYCDRMKRNHDKVSRMRTFTVGEEVYVFDVNGGPQNWVPGIVTAVVSSTSYMVHFRGHERQVHANHLKKCEVGKAGELLRQAYGRPEGNNQSRENKPKRILPLRPEIKTKDQPAVAPETEGLAGLRRSERKRQPTERFALYRNNQREMTGDPKRVKLNPPVQSIKWIDLHLQKRQMTGHGGYKRDPSAVILHSAQDGVVRPAPASPARRTFEGLRDGTAGAQEASRTQERLARPDGNHLCSPGSRSGLGKPHRDSLHKLRSDPSPFSLQRDSQ